jgi:hypothetical protein
MKKTRIDTVDFRHGFTLSRFIGIQFSVSSLPRQGVGRGVCSVANPDEIGTVAKPLFVRGSKYLPFQPERFF